MAAGKLVLRCEVYELKKEKKRFASVLLYLSNFTFNYTYVYICVWLYRHQCQCLQRSKMSLRPLGA